MVTGGDDKRVNIWAVGEKKTDTEKKKQADLLAKSKARAMMVLDVSVGSTAAAVRPTMIMGSMT